MKEERCEGLILQVREQGEKDKVLVCFTKEYGKLSFRVPRAQSSSAFQGALQTFTKNEFFFQSRKETWNVLKRLEPLPFSFFPHFDLKSFASASLATEILLRLSKEGEPNPEAFQFLETFFHFCEKGTMTPKTYCRMILRMMELAGYRPNWNECLSCQKTIDGQQSVFWDLSGGSLACLDCASLQEESTYWFRLNPIPWKALNALQHKTSLPLQRIPWKQMVQLLDKRIEEIVGYPLKSRSFFQEILGF